jgi:hypothetical protein
VLKYSQVAGVKQDVHHPAGSVTVIACHAEFKGDARPSLSLEGRTFDDSEGSPRQFQPRPAQPGLNLLRQRLLWRTFAKGQMGSQSGGGSVPRGGCGGLSIGSPEPSSPTSPVAVSSLAAPSELPGSVRASKVEYMW